LAAADLPDIGRESPGARKLYGLDNPATAGYGTRCLLARRLAEAGVRFVQVFPALGHPWDTHSDSKKSIESICAKVDLPAAALIDDLKGRGLLDSTVVLWT